ncbi:putative leucine-rich repeat receptor-like protein kinase [Camellia lanceoleosa]|uniref:Leucine-rich repeat receptor-like protein kinase n=1 Tax=Camellia lanceoleosa TaxID=1840588 RepID=A0ACC0HKL1_9ERIC|nr:putative leucine-rich repeat receptor-like protein kinase [Camellia lanceoleosa]
MVNERCDVYSFGVHTLELITGKHLGDLISSLSSLSSFSSSTSTVHGILLKDVLDQRLLPPKNQSNLEIPVLLYNASKKEKFTRMKFGYQRKVKSVSLKPEHKATC